MTRGAPIGDVVGIRMEHWSGDRPTEGDYLWTEAGSTYLIMDVRIPRAGTKIAENGGFTIQAEKVTRDEMNGVDESDPDVTCHEMYWTKRRKR